VAKLNPFVRTEAETIAWSVGLKTEVCSEGGINVTQISNGDFIKVKNVELGAGATSMEARVAAAQSGGSIEVRLDSETGTKVGTCEVKATGGAQTWATITCPLTGATGLHDLVFKFVGGSGELFKFDWWKLSGPGMSEGGSTDGGAVNGPDTGAGGSGGRDGGVTSAGGSGGKGGTGGVASRSGGTVASGGSKGGTTGSTSGTPTAGSAGNNGSESISVGGNADSSAGGSVSSSAGGSGGQRGSEGPVGSDGNAGGCSCQSGPGRAPGGFAALTFLLLVLAHRRRMRGMQ
jgi:arabinoxylan arabinofuranohydrolase